jgi:hypothetical protein
LKIKNIQGEISAAGLEIKLGPLPRKQNETLIRRLINKRERIEEMNKNIAKKHFPELKVCDSR